MQRQAQWPKFLYYYHMSENIQRLLRIQTATARTPFGREIGEKSVELVQKTITGLQQGKPHHTCINCGIILLADYFPSGCPNCGAKQETKDEEI